MGIDAHSLSFLRYAHKKHGAFGHTATLGRQAVHLGPKSIQHWLGEGAHYGDYCEPMLKQHFGASVIDSLDNSPYEKATVIADLNKPLPSSLKEKYDTVIDLGCTEHVFDVAQSIRNIVMMCKPGGTILHLVPASGFCGHGFYQFSPEFYFSCYSTLNGFEQTEVFLADLRDIRHVYRVLEPNNGERINVQSLHETYVIALTKRTHSGVFSVQQSDYVHAWNSHSTVQSTLGRRRHIARLRELLDSHPIMSQWLHSLDAARSPTAPRKLQHHTKLLKVKADALCK